MLATSVMAALASLDITGSMAAWRAIGLVVSSDGLLPFLSGSIQIVEQSGSTVDVATPRIHGWSLSGIDDSVTRIDGLVTASVTAPGLAVADHPNGAYEIDHVVVLTNSLERTCGAIADTTGEPLKRVREVGRMRQGFHRLGRGGIVVEVVERPEYDEPIAAFWGVVFNVTDLDAAIDLIGDELVGEANDAVQPGRRIATVRAAAGLGVPVALMSPPA